MSYRRLRAMFIKELHHVTRDSRSLAMALAMPMMMLLLYGYALSLDVDHIPDPGLRPGRQFRQPQSHAPVSGLAYFDIIGFVNDYRAIERAIDTSRILIGVAIPRGFGKDLEGRHGQGATAGGRQRFQYRVDRHGVRRERGAGLFRPACSRDASIVRACARPARSMRACASGTTARSNRRTSSCPGLVAVIMVILAGQLSSLTIAREWEMGTMEQVLSTPLRPTEIVLGKMLAYFPGGAGGFAIAIIVAITVFTVPFRGSFWCWRFPPALSLVRAVWGIWVSAGCRSQVQAYQFGILVSFLPGFLLSGFTFSIDTMPKVIQGLSYFFPARYFVTIVKGVFLKGVDFRILWGEMLFLVLYGTLIFWRTVRKDESEGGLTMGERLRTILRKEFIQALREPRMRFLLFSRRCCNWWSSVTRSRSTWTTRASAGWTWTTRPRAARWRRVSKAPDGSTWWPRRAANWRRRRLLDRGQVHGVVRVLPGFARDLARGRAPKCRCCSMAPIPTPRRWCRPTPSR
jgi:ABC-2 type transport system permease protein